MLDVHIIHESRTQQRTFRQGTQGLRGSEDIQYSIDPNMSETGYRLWHPILEYYMPWLPLERSVSVSVDRRNRDSFFDV
jgi:hypothetical protein